MNHHKILLLFLLFLLLVGCDGQEDQTPLAATDSPTATSTIVTPTLAPPTDTVPPPTNTVPAPTNTLPPPTNTVPPPTNTVPPIAGSPTPADQCVLTSLDDVTIYMRPDPNAAVFGTLAAGDSVEAVAITSNVWFGFDPGVAQAPNVGPFRYRWIPTSPAFITQGGTCDQLPIIEGPPAGICFAMVHGDIPVLSDPDPAAEVVAMLSADDYVEALGRIGTDWYQVDLSVGSEGLDQQGWITGFIDFNGPCEELPELQP